MTEHEDVAKIAAELNEDAKAAILSFSSPYYSRHIPQNLANKLVGAGLLSGPGRSVGPKPDRLPPQYILTERGLRVRAYLEEQTNAD